MKRLIFTIGLLITIALLGTGCRNKRISYTDMIKRENKEIKAFMDKSGIKVLADLPKDLKMAPNEFFELKNEVNEGLGVWINIIEAGDKDHMAENGKTSIICRFSYQAIGERLVGPLSTFSNIGPTNTDKPGVTFVYQENIDTEFQRGSIAPAPNSSLAEENMQNFACNAMMLALKYVPVGSTIKMITSFREGPNFTFQSGSGFSDDNQAGVALYYDQMNFKYKR